MNQRIVSLALYNPIVYQCLNLLSYGTIPNEEKCMVRMIELLIESNDDLRNRLLQQLRLNAAPLLSLSPEDRDLLLGDAHDSSCRCPECDPVYNDSRSIERDELSS